MNITTIGLDLAKNMLQVHGADARGKTLLRKQLRRAEVLAFFANLTPCIVGMEACASSHYWARKLQELGHDVRLVAPQYVKPYVKRNKNDVADAEAILSIHRARQGFVKARTAQANQISGLLAEFGIAIPQGISHVYKRVPEIIEDGEQDLPGNFRQLIARLVEHLKVLDTQVEELEQQIRLWHKENEASRRLAEIPGVGPITASALVASVGDARNFKNGRQLAAWLGLVPRQHSSGGKATLLGISKRGDTYLRTLLVHGARAVLRVAENKPIANSWVLKLAGRRHKNIAAVALANKTARIIWALLAHSRQYQIGYGSILAQRRNQAVNVTASPGRGPRA